MSKKLRNIPLGRIGSAMRPDIELNFAEIKLYKETCGTHPQSCTSLSPKLKKKKLKSMFLVARYKF